MSFEESMQVGTLIRSTWRNQKFRDGLADATKHVTIFYRDPARDILDLLYSAQRCNLFSFRVKHPQLALESFYCRFPYSTSPLDARSIHSRMRLTIPRWTSAVSEATGKSRGPIVDWLQSLDGHDKRRRDVINPALCDEALDLLRPSLPPPSTCDIIDINPGAGIWSQQLHQVLKPRRHVFVETEYKNYKKALEPLLRQSESAYRLAPTINDALDDKQDFLSPQLRETCASAASPSSTSQLIITANLAQRVVASNGFQGPMSKLFLEHYYRSIAMGTGAFPWHRYGFVRLLAWVPEADKLSFMPRCTLWRFRSAKQLEAVCHVTEFVSPSVNNGSASMIRPWYRAQLDSAEEVAAKSSASKIIIPTYRQQPSPQPPTSFYTPIEQNFPLLQSIKNRPPLVNEYIAAYNEFKASDPEWLDRFMQNPKMLMRERIKDKTHPKSRFAQLRSRMKTTHGHHQNVDALAQQQVDIERRLIAFRRNDPEDIAGYRDLVKTITPMWDRLKSQQGALFKDSRVAVKKAVDDLRALLHTPHVLSWNNRTFEPLLCHPKKDFYPNNAMSLMDFIPRLEYVQTFNTGERQITFDYLSHVLDFVRAISVKEALSTLVGGDEAFEKFVGKIGEPGGIPSLTDPLYGGLHDLDDFRLRTMSIQQLTDVVLAYEKWPWRLSVNAMIDAVSTSYMNGRKVL